MSWRSRGKSECARIRSASMRLTDVQTTPRVDHGPKLVVRFSKPNLPIVMLMLIMSLIMSVAYLTLALAILAENANAFARQLPLTPKNATDTVCILTGVHKTCALFNAMDTGFIIHVCLHVLLLAITTILKPR